MGGSNIEILNRKNLNNIERKKTKKNTIADKTNTTATAMVVTYFPIFDKTIHRYDNYVAIQSFISMGVISKKYHADLLSYGFTYNSTLNYIEIRSFSFYFDHKNISLFKFFNLDTKQTGYIYYNYSQDIFKISFYDNGIL